MLQNLQFINTELTLKNNALFIGRTGERIHHNSLKNLFDRYIKIAGLSGKGYTIHTSGIPLLQDF